MTLNFLQYLKDGTPTNFVRKITYGLVKEGYCTIGNICEVFRNSELPFIKENYSDFQYEDKIKKEWRKFIDPKIHTIRAGNRWNSGIDIHFKIWTGKPYVDKTFNFARIIPCVSVQDIEIKWRTINKGLGSEDRNVKVYIDGNNITTDYKLLDRLIVNDGLENRKQFFDWFNEDFKGQIIHFSNLRY